MATVSRKCDNCGNTYSADTRNLKRGWGLTCSKSCAASKREKSKPGYNPQRVETNNVRRALWNIPPLGDNVTGYTSEGYRIIGGVAYDEFDDPVYNVDPYDDDPGDSMYWDSKDY